MLRGVSVNSYNPDTGIESRSDLTSKYTALLLATILRRRPHQTVLRPTTVRLEVHQDRVGARMLLYRSGDFIASDIVYAKFWQPLFA